MAFFRFTLLAVAFAFCSSTFADQCLESAPLKQLDARYEQALLQGDAAYLATMLSDQFVWVHNLAVEIETKPVLLQRLQSNSYQPPLSRVSEDVDVRRVNDTAIVMGQTTVTQSQPDGKDPRVSRYHFMRTYVLVDGRCHLLGNKTVKIWSNEPDAL